MEEREDIIGENVGDYWGRGREGIIGEDRGYDRGVVGDYWSRGREGIIGVKGGCKRKIR